MKNNDYRLLVGLEIHVELKTHSKMFCQCSADWFGMAPNTNTCPVCLGMPGALPVPNKQAIEWIIKIGKALGCTINAVSKFDRKHYFYPDLAKGYQISQYHEPFCEHGSVEVLDDEGKAKSFRIRRVHMEEDTGKLTHGAHTKVDFNRAGVPLVEIVTEADFDSSDDVKRFLEELHAIIRALGVSDANMERGSMRLEPNISVRKPAEDGFPPYKVEVKNINSFAYVKKAIDYEYDRQVEMLKSGETPTQETRGYSEQKGMTISQRVKEDAADYRYFPEPDIPPFVLEPSYIDAITVPELPSARMRRYMKDMGVRAVDAYIISRDNELAQYFESVATAASGVKPQAIVNAINNKKLSTDLPIEDFAKQLRQMSTPIQTDNSLLATVIAQVLETNQKAVDEYRGGKETVIMFLVGQVMRAMQGKADANTVKSALEKTLKAR